MLVYIFASCLIFQLLNKDMLTATLKPILCSLNSRNQLYLVKIVIAGRLFMKINDKLNLIDFYINCKNLSE